MQKTVLIAVAASVVVLLMADFGVTKTLGAHPVAWPVKVAVFGAPAGAFVAVLAGLLVPAKMPRIILFLLLTLIAYYLAENGHKEFSASYGDDVTAGKFWFFGWIATCAAFTALLATIAGR